MDGKTFDSLVKLGATSTGRRRLFQAVGAAGIGGFLRGGGAAAGFVAEACQDRQTKCNRTRNCECKNGNQYKNVSCDPLPKKCKSGQRCCGKKDATCKEDCDCCKGFECNKNKKKCVKS